MVAGNDVDVPDNRRSGCPVSRAAHFLAATIGTAALAISLLAGLTAPAHAAERCHDLAAMYQMTYSLRDAGLTDAQTMTHTRLYQGFTDAERMQAIYRVRREGELGYMTSKSVYRHVYLDCRGVQ